MHHANSLFLYRGVWHCVQSHSEWLEREGTGTGCSENIERYSGGHSHFQHKYWLTSHGNVKLYRRYLKYYFGHDFHCALAADMQAIALEIFLVHWIIGILKPSGYNKSFKKFFIKIFLLTLCISYHGCQKDHQHYRALFQQYKSVYKT